MLRFLESGDHYNSDTGGNAKWQVFSANSVAGGRTGRGLEVGIQCSKTIDYQSEWIVGWAFILNEGVGFAVANLYQLSSCGVALVTLKTLSDGTLALYGGNSAVFLGASDPLKALHLNTWYYVEVKMQLAGGSGVINVAASCRVNGVIFIAPATVSTGVSGSALIINDSKANQHQFYASNISGNTVIDDIYIADTQTGDVIDFVGDITVFCLYPRADVTTDWSATGSPSYTQVNEQYAENSPGTNIFSNTIGQIESFDWQPIASFVGTIIGVHYGVYAMKDAEGSRTINQTVGPGGSPELTGPNISPSDTFVYFFIAMDRDPGTAATWTQAGFNSTQFGITMSA
jgi:hypothetical protein